MNRDAVKATAQTLIRRPVAEVFEAFVNPDTTTKFWFTKSSGRLEPSAHVQWDWEMYGVSDQVDVKAFEPNKRILMEWGSEGDARTTVEWVFESRADDETYIVVTNSGFKGTDDEIVQAALDSMGGFTTVLCGAKALLEHDLQLNLVADKFPDAWVKQ
jgi:uncharacterized protein YndB with AHSA1/START domain